VVQTLFSILEDDKETGLFNWAKYVFLVTTKAVESGRMQKKTWEEMDSLFRQRSLLSPLAKQE
jgi:hypothetical protein